MRPKALLFPMQLVAMMLIMFSVHFYLNKQDYWLYVIGAFIGFLAFRYAAREEGRIKAEKEAQPSERPP